MLRFGDLEGQGVFRLIASKMRAVSLPLGDGELLTDPAQFIARLDDVDARAFYWIATLPALEYGRLGRLWKRLGRQWLKSYVQTLETTTLTARRPASRHAKGATVAAGRCVPTGTIQRRNARPDRRNGLSLARPCAGNAANAGRGRQAETVPRRQSA